MGNFDSSVGDSSVATFRNAENAGPLLSESQQSSIQDKKAIPNKEPQTGYLDMSSGEVVPQGKKDLSVPAHRITPEEYKTMAEAKQAIARKMEEHVFTPQELKSQELKQQLLEDMQKKGLVGGISITMGEMVQKGMKEASKGEKQAGEKHTKVSTADGSKIADAKPVDAKPVEGKKPWPDDAKNGGTKDGDKSTKDGKEASKGEPADKKLTAAQLEKLEAIKAAGKKGQPADAAPELTDAQWEKLRQMKLAAEAAHGTHATPVDGNGNGKKPSEKPVPTPGEKPGVKPGSTEHIDPGHSKPKPGAGNEKPPVPKDSEG